MGSPLPALADLAVPSRARWTGSLSEWAEARRVLPEWAARPGRFCLAPTPYLRAVLDALHPDAPHRRIVVMKGAQVGASEAACTAICYWVAHVAAPIMYVQPSFLAGRTFLRTRIDPALQSIPECAEKTSFQFRDARNSAMRKAFAGGELYIAGANSRTSLSSVPVRLLTLDEVDGYPGDVDGGGDPATLAMARAITYGDRAKVFLLSTPTDAGESRIETAYAETDKREWHVACQHCGERQALDWHRVRWPSGAPEQAAFFCKGCGAAHDDHVKPALVASGEWVATAPDPIDQTAVGFHVPGLLSPWLSFADAAREYEVQRRDPLRLRVFITTVVGIPFDNRGAGAVPPDTLASRREPWHALPERAAVVTAGVDVQSDRIEATAIAWGPGEEAWVAEHRAFHGDPTTGAVWDELDGWLATARFARADGATLPITATAVDTGGSATSHVYRFVSQRIGRGIYGVKGRAGSVPPWPKRPGKAAKTTIFTIGVDALKSTLYARLRTEPPGPATFHFHADLDDEWFAQLVAERRVVTVRRGRRVTAWICPDGERNEALDCVVYAMSALHALYARGLRFDRDAAVPREREAPAEVAVTVTRPRPRGPIRSRFMEARPWA
jgi:phage terminase large subunit GpA-like protein